MTSDTYKCYNYDNYGFRYNYCNTTTIPCCQDCQNFCARDFHLFSYFNFYISNLRKYTTTHQSSLFYSSLSKHTHSTLPSTTTFSSNHSGMNHHHHYSKQLPLPAHSSLLCHSPLMTYNTFTTTATTTHSAPPPQPSPPPLQLVSSKVFTHKY